MKVSISLPEDDVEFLDDYAERHGISSRSAAVQRAIRLLRGSGLASAYERAWSEWDANGDADVWDATVADGVG